MGFCGFVIVVGYKPKPKRAPCAAGSINARGARCMCVVGGRYHHTTHHLMCIYSHSHSRLLLFLEPLLRRWPLRCSCPPPSPSQCLSLLAWRCWCALAVRSLSISLTFIIWDAVSVACCKSALVKPGKSHCTYMYSTWNQSRHALLSPHSSPLPRFTSQLSPLTSACMPAKSLSSGHRLARECSSGKDSDV